MKSAVFITVRTDSTRLPNKAFRTILGRPTIELVASRAMRAKADETVLCTTDRAVDDELARVAQRMGIKLFRGSCEDKLDRWRNAAALFGIDYFSTMDGDDLLCDPELLSLGLRRMAESKVDFIKAPEGLICGAFTYCVRVQALNKVCEMKGTTDTEMMWVYFEDTGRFSVEDLPVTERVFFEPGVRMTLDYPEDFEFFTRIFEGLGCPGNDVPLREVVAFLRRNPGIPAINYFRQNDFLANQKRKTKLVLKKQP